MRGRTGRWLLGLAGLVGAAHADEAPSPSDAAPAAIFWANGRTWLVTTGPEPRLWFAQGWYGPDGDGVRRYRLRTEARRAAGAEAASRWTRLWSAGPGERRFSPLTAAPAAAPDGSAFTDEETVLQFRGDAVGLARFRREVDAGGRAFLDATASTLDLPDAEAAPLPASAAAAVAFAQARLPGVVDACVSRPVGRLPLEARGGGEADWLVLGQSGPDCPGQAHAARLGPKPEAAGMFSGLRWDGQALREGDKVRVDGVFDLRVAPSGRHALLVVGEPGPAGGALRSDLLGFDAPCPRRRLLFWSAAVDAPVDVGAADRLDGLRWVTGPGHPLLAMAPTHFLPVDAPCFHGVPEYLPGATAADGRVADWPALEPTGHACRVEEWGVRAWGGPDDLSAAVAARRDGDALALVVRVRDDAPRPEDTVRVWIGANRPLRLEATAEGLRDRAPHDVDTAWGTTDDGYVFEARFPVALAGDPPAISVRVDDTDAPGDDALRLWAGGGPADAGRKPLPLEPAEVP